MRSHSSAQVQTSSKRTPSALTQRSCAPRGRVFASCSQQDPSTSSHAAARHEGREPGSQVLTSAARRQVLLLSSASLLGGALSRCLPAQAAGVYAPPPAGFRSFLDKLDGYTFYYPERWLPVTVTGNDCFFRNPTNIDENLFVDFSSPSSSKYRAVTDLGTPDMAAQEVLNQLLSKEFMSTRLGIKREGQVLSANSREGKDGRTYYDIAIRITSYASRSPYLATQGEVLRDYGVEWDRVLLTTLGVANGRLYEFRLQTAQNTLDKSLPLLTEIAQSFALQDIEQA